MGIIFFGIVECMENVLVVYKHIGETPLEVLERVRISKGLDPMLPMTYAGRLDPMAEGVLIVLIGEECKQKEKYLGLTKEYEVELLFGIGTDTGDLLGKIVATSDSLNQQHNIQYDDEIRRHIELRDMGEIIKKLEGKFVQEYPVFSSKTVAGEPLFALAKSGNLPETLPTKEVEIFSIDLLEQREMSSEVLLDYIVENIAKVKGDFRQEEIVSLWQDVLQGNNTLFPIVKIKVSCSSGTYMRALAERLGCALNIPALAFSIKRTRVGNIEKQ
jgi:tRNA pseudouridine55 synthase